MYEKEHEQVRELFFDLGLPPPEVEIKKTRKFFSYTECDGIIYMGKSSRALSSLGTFDIKVTILHEMLHNFIAKHELPKDVMEVFGIDEIWDVEQDWFAWFTADENHCDRYAATHPIEDVVCCLTHMLRNDDWACNYWLQEKEHLLGKYLESIADQYEIVEE